MTRIFLEDASESVVVPSLRKTSKSKKCKLCQTSLSERQSVYQWVNKTHLGKTPGVVQVQSLRPNGHEHGGIGGPLQRTHPGNLLLLLWVFSTQKAAGRTYVLQEELSVSPEKVRWSEVHLQIAALRLWGFLSEALPDKTRYPRDLTPGFGKKIRGQVCDVCIREISSGRIRQRFQ